MGQNVALDSLRLEHEHDYHWKHRRHFIEVNVQDFDQQDIDQLVSLSMTWANMKFDGCRYPPELMQRVALMAERMEAIDDAPVEARVKKKGDVVLPEGNAGFKLMQKMGWEGSGLGRNQQGITDPVKAVQITGRHGLGGQSHSDTFNKAGEKRTTNRGREFAMNKKSKTGEESSQNNWDLGCEFEPVDHTMAAAISPVLGRFVNIQTDIDNAIGALHASAQLNHKCLQFEHACLSPNEHEVVVYIEDLLIGKAVADNQKDAKRLAAEQGLDLLKSLYPTVVKKSLQACTEEFREGEIAVNDICREDPAAMTDDSREEGSAPAEPTYELPDHNAGFKLLQKMGWKGQGLGKESQGRTAPVIPEILPKRAGLGIDLEKHKDNQGNIVTRDMDRMVIYQLLQEVFMGERELLTFSPSLTKGERAQIHKMCNQQGLKSQSIGSGENRKLTVRRKMNKRQLQALAQSGSKLFELEAPVGW